MCSITHFEPAPAGANSYQCNAKTIEVSRERAKRWYFVFRSSGHIMADRCNAASTANQKEDERKICNSERHDDL